VGIVGKDYSKGEGRYGMGEGKWGGVMDEGEG